MIPEDYERLRRERDLAEQYLNISGAIILSLDLTGTVRLLNKPGETILGYTQDEILGKNWFDLAIPEDQRAAVRRDFEAVVASGTARAAPFENEVLTKAGERLSVGWNEAVVRGDAGNMVSVLSSGTDLTQKKHIENALRESTERLQDFTDAASDWLWEMDPDLKFSFLSPGLSRILGMSADEMLGKSRADFAAISEINAQTRAKWDSHLDDLNNHRPFRDFEYESARADGSTLHIRVSGKPVFDCRGRFAGYRGTGRDMTAEITAQQQAVRAQELLMHTIEGVPTMMVLFDAEERFVMCNQSYREALHSIDDLLVPGVTLEEISRVSAQRGLVGEYRDDPEGWVRTRLERFRNPGEPVIHRQLDGRWVMTTDYHIPGGGTLIMRTDITALKEAEDDRRAKEATLLSFLDAMRDPAAMVDLDANFILVNRAMAAQYGAKPQDLIGTAMFQDPPTEAGRQRRAWIDEVATTGVALRKTDFYGDCWNDINITPVFDAHGKVSQIALVARDITQDVTKDVLLRKLSLATEQSADLVVITDLQGKIEYVNKKFTETTGYSAEEVLGQNPRMLASGDTPRAVYDDLWKTVLSGKTWRGDLQDRRKDHSSFWSAVTIAPIHDANGNIVNFVSSHVDISERKAAESVMREAMLHTEIANRAKDELLANMSHELRTPLNAIIGFSSMMNERVYGPMENPHYDEYAKIINNSACHLLDIINDILDVSAIEAGKLSLHEETFAVEEVIVSTLVLVEQRAQEGGVSVSVEISRDAPYLFADPRRFKQIVLNLVSNAVKFTPQNGKVQVDYYLDGEGRPTLCVTDTGIGMDAQGIAVALTQFGQADSGHTRKYEGTGLGLPLTMGLVEMHDGTMDVQSAKGLGTSVTIVFPKNRSAHLD